MQVFRCMWPARLVVLFDLSKRLFCATRKKKLSLNKKNLHPFYHCVANIKLLSCASTNNKDWVHAVEFNTQTHLRAGSAAGRAKAGRPAGGQGQQNCASSNNWIILFLGTINNYPGSLIGDTSVLCLYVNCSVSSWRPADERLTSGFSARRRPCPVFGMLTSGPTYYCSCIVPVNPIHAGHVREWTGKKVTNSHLFSLPYETCRVQNPDIPRAGCIWVHGWVAGQGRAGLFCNGIVRPEKNQSWHSPKHGKIAWTSPQKQSQVKFYVNWWSNKACGWTAVHPRFFNRTRSAFCSWPPSSGPTFFRLCKPFSCRACPGIW